MRRIELLALGLLCAALPLFQGCQAAHAMSAPKVELDDSHPFAKTELLEDVLTRHADAAEATSNDMKDVKAQIASLSEQMTLLANQQCDLSKAVEDLRAKPIETSPEPSRATGESPDVPLVDESELLNSDSDCLQATISTGTGERWNLNDFINQYYKGPWTHPGDIDSHLATHGVNFTGDSIDTNTKEQLHAAIHERELALAEPTPIAGVNDAPCPDGKCPQRSRSVVVTSPDASRSVSRTVYSTVTPHANWSVPSTYSRSVSYSYQRPLSRAAARRAARCAGGNCCR